MDHGLIVDIETTGLDPLRDSIIEVGVLEFLVEDDEPPVIAGMYSAVEELPAGCSLPPEVGKLVGLEPRHLQGKHIDWQLVRTLFGGAAVVIAHNADFDRAFLCRRPELADLKTHWACSMRHVDWRRHGYATQSLTYLAADHGFVNPFPHRALFDCATTFKLIRPHLAELVERSYERETKLLARGAPYAAKDKLRQQGYRWDSEARVWVKVVSASQLNEERAFLTEICGVQGGAEEIVV